MLPHGSWFLRLNPGPRAKAAVPKHLWPSKISSKKRWDDMQQSKKNHPACLLETFGWVDGCYKLSPYMSFLITV